MDGVAWTGWATRAGRKSRARSGIGFNCLARMMCLLSNVSEDVD